MLGTRDACPHRWCMWVIRESGAECVSGCATGVRVRTDRRGGVFHGQRCLVVLGSSLPLLYSMCAVFLVAQSCPTLCDPMDCSLPGSSVHADSPGKNTGVGCHALLQGIFPTQGLNPGLVNCRWILYCLHHQGSLIECIDLAKVNHGEQAGGTQTKYRPQRLMSLP